MEILSALRTSMPGYTVVAYDPSDSCVTHQDKLLTVQLLKGTLHPWDYGNKFTAFRGTTFAKIGRVVPESVHRPHLFGVGKLTEEYGELLYMPDPYKFKVANDEDVVCLAEEYGLYEVGDEAAVMKPYGYVPSVDSPIAAWDAKKRLLTVIAFNFDLLETMHYADADDFPSVGVGRAALVDYAENWKNAFLLTLKNEVETFKADIDEYDATRFERAMKQFRNPAHRLAQEMLDNAGISLRSYRQQLDGVQARIAEVEELREKYTQKLNDIPETIDLSEQMAAVRNMPKVNSVTLDDYMLEVVYQDLYMKVHGVTYKLPNRLRVTFEHTGNISVYNADGDLRPHPHTYDGRMCAGNAGEVFPDLFAEARYLDAVDYMQIFLETSDPDDAWGKNYALYNFIDIKGNDKGVGWDYKHAKVWNTMLKLELIQDNTDGDMHAVSLKSPNMPGVVIPVPLAWGSDEIFNKARKLFVKLGLRDFELKDMYIVGTPQKHLILKEHPNDMSGKDISWLRSELPMVGFSGNSYSDYLLYRFKEYEGQACLV